MIDNALQRNAIRMIADCCSEKTLVIQFQRDPREQPRYLTPRFCNVSRSLKLPLKTIYIHPGQFVLTKLFASNQLNAFYDN